MRVFPCSYLKGNVELSDEREVHIAQNHPDLLPAYLEQIGKTLAEPDQVRRSTRLNAARLFSRWFGDILRGKYVVVVVVSETAPHERNWIITAYLARGLAKGEIEWSKD
jgi:hypothetical protein